MVSFCQIASKILEPVHKIPRYIPEYLNYETKDDNSFFMRQFDLIAVSLTDWQERRKEFANSQGISLTTTVTLIYYAFMTKDIRRPQNK